MTPSKVTLFSIALYLTIACFVSMPFYIYGMYKWIQFKQHFLVTKRFPLVSNMIVIVSLITMINEISRRWLNYINGSPMSDHYGLVFFRSVASANTFLICSLPVYRLLLIYLKWKKSQSAINNILKDTESNPSPPTAPIASYHSKLSPLSASATGTPQSKTSPIASNSPISPSSVNSTSSKSDTIYTHYGNISHENVSQQITSITLALFIFVGYVAILARDIATISNLIIGMIWFCQIIGSICLIVLVKVEQVHEGIGCLREAYMIILLLIIHLVAQIISIVDHWPIFDEYIVHYLSATFIALFGLLPIYIALYYIKQCEGSLDITKWRDKFDEDIYKSRKSMMISKVSLHSTSIPSAPIPIAPSSRTSSLNTIRELTIVIEPHNNITNVQKQKAKNTIIAALDLKCLDFLKTEANYKAFATYLGHCFAIENLLFMERVSILYELVRKLKTEHIQNNEESETMDNIENMRHEMKRNKFEYLNTIYFEYQRKINKWSLKYNKDKEIDIGSMEYYKKALFKVYCSIYEEYVQSEATNQVNLSAEVRGELLQIFEDLNALQRFKSFDDFMYIFDGALIEIYRLVFSIYAYRFKKWCREQ